MNMGILNKFATTAKSLGIVLDDTLTTMKEQLEIQKSIDKKLGALCNHKNIKLE